MNVGIKVRFKGIEYWLLAPPDGDYGPLAPLDHCDDGGKLKFESTFYVSFAHVWEDGNISRYGEIIGTREDLERV